MVGYPGVFVDGEVSALAEVFDEVQGVSFGDLMSEERDQKADECFLAPRSGGGAFAEVFQNPCFPFGQGGRLSLWFCWGLRLLDGGERGWSRRLRWAGECERGEANMTFGGDVPASEMLDERVVTGVL